MHYCCRKHNLNGAADEAVKVKLRRVGWSWLRIFCENRAGLCRVIGGQALKQPQKEQKALFVQNTMSKAQRTVKRLYQN